MTWSATVDYGDGSGRQPLGLNPDKTFVLNYRYATSGSFRATLTVTDKDGGIGAGSIAVNVLPPPVVVQSVRLVTKKKAPTGIVLTFSGPLNPARALILGNYRLAGPGRDKKLGARDDKITRLRSAVYDPRPTPGP